MRSGITAKIEPHIHVRIGADRAFARDFHYGDVAAYAG
jgi:hypothetical protein